MNDSERRQNLSEFLRSCRARLSPADVGLPGSKRRRTPGLRREEVALLANIGVAWYVALEQGRDIHPSEEVLESIAGALRLTATEHQHFLVLAGHSPTIPAASEDEPVSFALEQAVRALDPNPAFVLGRRWDVLAWNRAAAAVLTYRQTATAVRPQNLIWSHFTDPLIKEIYPDWEQSAQLMAALLRTESALFPGDAWFGEMIEKLQQESAFFRHCWSRYEIDRAGMLDGWKEMEHPILGHLEFDTVTLLIPAHPGLKLILYVSAPATLVKLNQQLASPTSAETLVQELT